MKDVAAGASLTGRIRKNNEDNFCVDERCLPLIHENSDTICTPLSRAVPHLLGVFDGMGGCNDGEIASYLAASTAQEYARHLKGERDVAGMLTALCLEANEKVCKAADGAPMGTTCALLYLSGSDYTVCNVGDSPVFLFRNGILRQISVDHTQRASYEKVTGKPAEARRKFPLTQCLGIPQDEMVIEPFLDGGKICAGDVFLLCSDGITDMLSTEEICRALSVHTSPDEMVADLTKMAMEAGGRDNLTAVCFVAGSGAWKPGCVIKRLLSHVRHEKNSGKELAE